MFSHQGKTLHLRKKHLSVFNWLQKPDWTTMIEAAVHDPGGNSAHHWEGMANRFRLD